MLDFLIELIADIFEVFIELWTDKVLARFNKEKIK